MTSDKIYWWVWPKVTPEMKWRNVLQMVDEISKEIRRECSYDSRQVTLFYYKFREYEIKAGQDKKHAKREVQAKLF